MTYTRDALTASASCLGMTPEALQNAIVLHDTMRAERDRYRAALVRIVGLKRTAQQERDAALGLVKTHRAERNAARGWVEDLARAITGANTAPSTYQLGVKAITWLRCQSGYGAPSGAVEVCLDDAESGLARGSDHALAVGTFAAVKALARLVLSK